MFEIRKMQEQALFSAIAVRSNRDTAAKIVYGKRESVSSEEKDWDWVKETMDRLEAGFPKDQVKRIRMDCQCGYAMEEKLQLLHELVATTGTLAEFGNHPKAKAAGMYVREGNLFLQFYFCPCPMLAEVDHLDSDAWCQCTTGYSKTLFEKAFGCPVDVELLKSIKMGDEVCLQKITPKEAVWK